MNNWKLEIKRVDNGYLLTEIITDTSIATNEVIDDRTELVIEDTEDELESHEKLLWEVMDYFGFRGSKHENRIRIIRENNKGELC